MFRWLADATLNSLLSRYYRGEAGLWETIRSHVDAELRNRGVVRGAYHLRFLRLDEGIYEVLIDDARGYEVAP
jgi:hypothetical protein